MPLTPITDEEKPLILALKAKNEKFDDFSDEDCVKFLRAKEKNVDDAAEMLAEHLTWLHKWKPSTITTDDIKNALPNGSIRYLGKAKSGSLVILCDARYWRPEKYDSDENIRYFAFWVNHLTKMMDGPTGQIITIFDQSEFSLSQTTYVNYDLEYVSIAQNHFPESLELAYVLNGSTFFEIVWKIVSPLLRERTTSKIKFLSGDEVAPGLLEIIDASVLPKAYGGNAELPPMPNLPGVENVQYE
eukprot:c12973_g1_i1.p1 GENE.c12973_g1_i1~~c12973_g1_i1.p1  ORF type:complete len:257 (+),score=112.24 c12973_g1_i1:42-773(+)